LTTPATARAITPEPPDKSPHKRGRIEVDTVVEEETAARRAAQKLTMDEEIAALQEAEAEDGAAGASCWTFEWEWDAEGNMVAVSEHEVCCTQSQRTRRNARLSAKAVVMRPCNARTLSPFVQSDGPPTQCASPSTGNGDRGCVGWLRLVGQSAEQPAEPPAELPAER
jgi:hypothetical protein